MIKAVFSDMDEVLVDSLKAHFKAFNVTIALFGREAVSMVAYKKTLWGAYLMDEIRTVFGEIPKGKLREISDEYITQVERYVGFTRADPDAEKILAVLEERGCGIGLITNSPRCILT